MPNLISHWKFDEGSGATAADSVVATPVYSPLAAEYNYASFTPITLSNTDSFSFWVTGLDGSTFVNLFLGGTGQPFISYRGSDHRLRLRDDSSQESTINTSTSMADGLTHFVQVNLGPNLFEVFIDGVAQPTSTSPVSTVTFGVIGAQGTSSGSMVSGAVWKVKLANVESWDMQSTADNIFDSVGSISGNNLTYSSPPATITSAHTIETTASSLSRKIEPLLINSDSPIETTIQLPAGDYILSASGTGSVVISGQGTINPAAGRRQLAFNLASSTSVIFTPTAIDSWMLEETTGQALQVASEYTPLNLDQSDGLAFAVGSPDGSPVTITANITVSSGVPTWEVDSGEQFTAVDLNHTFYNKINAFKLLPGSEATITQILLSSQNLIGIVPDLDLFINARFIYLEINNFVGFIPSLSSNQLLTNLRLFSNQIKGIIPGLSSNTALINAYLYSNQLTGYTASTISTTLIDFRAQNNLLTASAVNQMFADFKAAGHPNGTINVGGTGNAAPTGQGLIDAADMQANGWTVTHNG